MATEIPEKVEPDALNRLWDAKEKAKVDIVFVHGLRGHPQRTWQACDSDGDPVYWPKELLPTTMPESRIFSFGYPTQFATFFPVIKEDTIAHTNIDDNSTALLVRLGNYRRDTDTMHRPIIFVAHSLGGLVVANGLAGQSGSNEERQEVVNSTCGTVFLGTPFKGSSKAAWAIFAEKVSKLFGDSNDQTIKDLDKHSTKLQNISSEFHLLLQQRYESRDLNPIQVACFHESKKTGWKTKELGIKVTKDLGIIVTRESATIAGHKPMVIHKDHRDMCRFLDDQATGYIDVTKTIKFMLDNWGKKDATTEKESISISLGDVNYGDNGVNYGIQAGNVVGMTENAVNQSVSHSFASFGQDTSPSDPSFRAWEEKARKGKEPSRNT